MKRAGKFKAKLGKGGLFVMQQENQWISSGEDSIQSLNLVLLLICFISWNLFLDFTFHNCHELMHSLFCFPTWIGFCFTATIGWLTDFYIATSLHHGWNHVRTYITFLFPCISCTRAVYLSWTQEIKRRKATNLCSWALAATQRLQLCRILWLTHISVLLHNQLLNCCFSLKMSWSIIVLPLPVSFSMDEESYGRGRREGNQGARRRPQ